MFHPSSLCPWGLIRYISNTPVCQCFPWKYSWFLPITVPRGISYPVSDVFQTLGVLLRSRVSGWAGLEGSRVINTAGFHYCRAPEWLLFVNEVMDVWSVAQQPWQDHGGFSNKVFWSWTYKKSLFSFVVCFYKNVLLCSGQLYIYIYYIHTSQLFASVICLRNET